MKNPQLFFSVKSHSKMSRIGIKLVLIMVGITSNFRYLIPIYSKFQGNEPLMLPNLSYGLSHIYLFSNYNLYKYRNIEKYSSNVIK